MKLVILIGFKFFRRKIRWIGLFFVILFFLVFLQIKFKSFYATDYLSEGFVGTYQEHDIPQEVKRLLSDSMVTLDKSGRIKPNLSQNWDVNKDATEFKFIIKDNLYWADGSKIKSSDLEFNIPDVEISTPDDKTIQFKLKEPYSPFPSLLTKPVFKKGAKIGTGPYQIKKIEKSRIFITKITLESIKEDLPTLNIRFYPNEKVAITGFYMGEVQSLFGLTNPKVVNINPIINIKQITDYTKIVTILYNTKDPLFSNRSFRQALAYQAPKIAGEEEANSLYPKFYWVYKEDEKKYLSNPKEAKKTLERAESSLSEEKLKEDIYLTSTPNLEEVAKKIVSSWNQLGIDIKLRTESGIPQNFQALLITQSIPQDPDQYFLWHSTQTNTNLSKYSAECCPSSARVDKDLEDGRKIIKEEERKEKYIDFQKTLMEDAPATFLYFPKYNIIYLKKAEENLNKILDLQLAN